jgi:hypothetical protein
MRRWLVVAALGAVLVALPLWGQRRGGISSGFGGHAGIAARGSVGGMRGPAMGFHRPGFAGGPHTGFRPGFGRGPFFGNRFHHHRPWWGWGGYGYPWGWGYWYPWDYGDLGWDDNSSYAQQYYPQGDFANQYYGQNNQVQEQQAEIDRLNDEVERLREQRDAQRAAPAPAAKPQPTELVFRDKRTEEIQNYAISGQTLWVLTEQRARKIPLAELDIVATQKVNEERGVDFEIPR